LLSEKESILLFEIEREEPETRPLHLFKDVARRRQRRTRKKGKKKE